MNVALWIVQGLLAALFLFAGGAKLVLPLDQMAGPGSLAAGAVSRLVPPVGAPARKLSTKQPSRKEQTMSTGGFSKAWLGRMHDVMGFFCGPTVGLTLVATPAGIARNVIESMPSSSSSH